ncbi:MAG: hypothetical protein V4677_03265, partial [Bacteroidota bacterium]
SGYAYRPYTSLSPLHFQYSNLRIEILDWSTKTIIGSIIYNGRFEIEVLSKAIANKLDAPFAAAPKK